MPVGQAQETINLVTGRDCQSQSPVTVVIPVGSWYRCRRAQQWLVYLHRLVTFAAVDLWSFDGP